MSSTSPNHIAAIQETNIYLEEDIEDYYLEGYYIELDNLYYSQGRARTINYISQQIKYTRRKNLEVPGEPIIVLTIHPCNSPKFNNINHYRQWQQLFNLGAIKSTGTPVAQLERYKLVIEKWLKSLNERETIYSGDANIDLDKNFNKADTLSIQDAKTTPLYKLLRDKIFTAGVTLIKTVPTKHNLNSADTYLDHILTSAPEKIHSQTVHKGGYSDHYPVTFIHRTNNTISQPNYILARDYKIIDWDIVKDEMNNDIRLTQASLSNSPDEIAVLITESISDHINYQAPLKRIQVCKKTTTFATVATRNIIKERDAAKLRSDITGDQGDIRRFRHLRNQSHKALTKDKRDKDKQKFENIKDNDPKTQWNETKKVLGWRKSSTPKIIKNKGDTITSPQEIAQQINKDQILKNLHINIPSSNIDPIENYRKLIDKKKSNLKLSRCKSSEML